MQIMKICLSRNTYAANPVILIKSKDHYPLCYEMKTRDYVSDARNTVHSQTVVMDVRLRPYWDKLLQNEGQNELSQNVPK